MPPGLGLGLFASFAWGIVDVSAAVATRVVGSLRVLVGTQLVSLAVLVALAAAVPSLLGPAPLAGMLAGLPLGVLAAGAYLGYFTALRIGPLSVVSPVIAAYGGATVVLAVLFRGETLTGQQAAGAAVATAGVVLAGITFESRSLRGARLVGPGVVAAIATLAGFAALTLLLADPVRAHGWLPTVMGSRVGNSLAALALLGVAAATRAPRLGPLLEPALGWTRAAVVLTLASGVFDVLGFAAYAIGLGVAPVWLIGLASSFGPVLAVAYGIVQLGERPHATQWAGLGLIAAGIAVLALSG